MKTNSNTLRIIDIVDGTIVDGPGLRTTLYLAGCRHQCPGCHNPQTWDFDAGEDMTLEHLLKRIEDNDMNVTLSGGDPLYQIEAVVKLCDMIHSLGKTVWCYTGFTYEQIEASDALRPILTAADVLVDGPFIMAQRDLSLRFRGSSNQRIIDLPRSKAGNIVLWDNTDDFSILN